MQRIAQIVKLETEKTEGEPIYNDGVGGIRTHDLQRPRLTSCQARRRPLAFLGCNNLLYTVKFVPPDTISYSGDIEYCGTKTTNRHNPNSINIAQTAFILPKEYTPNAPSAAV